MTRRPFLILLMLFAAAGAQAAEQPLTVFAASSLKDVLEEAGKSYTAATKTPVRFSFDASSSLARQIEAGSPADVFVSADQEWMDYLATRNLIKAATRSNIVSNSLVLVAPAASTIKLRIAPGFGLAKALGSKGRLATGNPDSVPAGKYAKAALTKLGVWNDVKDRVIPADNVRTALNFVALGESPLGIVYATDARVSGKVRVVDTFPASSHEPIIYPAAATTAASADAAGFVKFLGSDSARILFDKAGFGKP